ncbi:MAG: gliding motility-associated C-terminal domain-containing protein, partial [Bacteroidetes bacterium]|nr:gliding motility-associated C-terminal domain-containing protein [Bacteroidota bacterium]
NLTYIVTNSFSCSDTNRQQIKMGGVVASFVPKDTTGCKYTPITFRDKSASDTTLTNWVWSFDDGDSAFTKNPTHIYTTKGFYKVKQYVMDARGCFDTITSDKTIIIGDSARPKPPTIYNVTVVDDETVTLNFKPYNDIDFAFYTVYKLVAGAYKPIKIITNINDTVFTEKKLKTLRNRYCYKLQVQTLCGKISNLDSAISHCTMDVSATPSINSVSLKWNQYSGWDSISNYEVYRVDKKDRTIETLIATIPGWMNNYVDSSVRCFAKYHYRIKAVKTYASGIMSYSDTTGGFPIHVPNPPKNEIIHATVVDNKKILLEWTTPIVKRFIIDRSSDGITYFPYKVFDSSISSFNDTNVMVNTTSYTYRMRVLDSCGDLSPFTNIGKSILLNVDSNTDGRPQLKWTAYQQWKQGIAYYDIELKQKDGSFMNIGRTVDGNETNFIDDVTDLNSLPEYCYRVIAHRSGDDITSTSNIDCTHIYSTLFIPNAFTPNHDKENLNEKFEIKGTYISQYQIKIYNRWGEKVFESDTIYNSWDGTFKGEKSPLDQYIYHIKAFGVTGEQYDKTGYIILLK